MRKANIETREPKVISNIYRKYLFVNICYAITWFVISAHRSKNLHFHSDPFHVPRRHYEKTTLFLADVSRIRVVAVHVVRVLVFAMVVP